MWDTSINTPINDMTISLLGVISISVLILLILVFNIWFVNKTYNEETIDSDYFGFHDENDILGI